MKDLDSDKSRQRPSPLASVLEGRLAVVELAVVAIVLALGVEFAASGLSALFAPSPRQSLLLAATLIALGGGLLFWRILTLCTHSVRLEGMFVCDRESKVPLAVPKYHFGDGLADILTAGFAENSALEGQWSSGAPGSRLGFPGPGPRQRDGAAAAKAAKLVEEAVEYFVLEELSMHLTDYFNRVEDAEKRTVELRREQVPEVLLTNRFLSLFSAPMEDRPAFMQGEAPSDHGGEIVAVFAKGARYRRFELVLPKSSRVNRTESGAIEISTPRLRLRVAVRYDGFSSNLPFEFCELYLQTPHDQLEARKVLIKIDVSLKLVGLLFGNWDYYRWVDSFVSTLDDQVSFDRFLRGVQWPAVAALLRCRRPGEDKAQVDDG